MIKFFISNEKVLNGKIIAHIYTHPQSILIATLVESKKREKETGEPSYKRINIFGQKTSQTEHNIIKEVHIPLYVYRFISNTNKDYVVFSQDNIDVGDYSLTGVETECSDLRALTESAKLPTKLPYFFIQKAQNRIIKFKNHQDFSKKVESLKIESKNFFNYPFCFTNGNINKKLSHPKWYKWLIWAWLTHQSKGLGNPYPMHMIQVADMHSGKSMMLNSLHSRSNEASNVFSGSSSTLKNLIPSFSHTPAKLGYLAESNRFSYCDEFLRCIMKTHSAKSGGNREDSVGTMNDLLEHQRREAGSGNSSVDVRMTSRIFATTNPVRGTSNMSSLLNSLDGSFLSRWLIYFQTPEHLNLIRNSRDSELKSMEYKISNNDWVSILDYLHSFSSKYDEERIGKIYKAYSGVFSESINNHYSSRQHHHIECLIDGIIKARCLINNDISFEATEEDYDVLTKVWGNVIGSWMTPQMIKDTPKTQRIYLMPEASQFLYWKIFNHGEEVEYQVLVDMVKEDLSGQEFVDAYYNLINSDLIIKKFGRVQVYDYYKAISDENQKNIGQNEL